MQIAGVQTAVVTNNQDPDQRGRVQVSFPWDSTGTSTAWAPVVQPMAGGQYGLYFVPEVGDQVIVAFENNNHDYPVVLGSIYTGSGKQSDCSDSNNYVKNIKTKAGNEIRFNDKPGEETIMITNPESKQYISLNLQDNGKITIESPNGEIDIVAKTVNIQGDTTNIKGQNITIEASGGFEAKGDTGIHLQSKQNLIAEAVTEMDLSVTEGDIKASAMNIDLEGNVGATLKGNATAEVSASGQTTVKGGIVMIN